MKLSEIESEQQARELLAAAKKTVVTLTDLLTVIDRAQALSSKGLEAMRRNLLQMSLYTAGGIRVEHTNEQSRDVSAELVDAAIKIVNAEVPEPKICNEAGCGHKHSSHFSCEVGSFCKECSTENQRWEHTFKI